MHLQSIFRVDTSSTDCLLLIALVFSNVFIPAASAAPLSSQAQHELTDLLEPHHRSLQARQSDAEERYILANCDLGSGNKYSQIAQFSSGTSSTPLQISEITPSSGVEGPIKWEGTQHTAYFPDKTKFYVNIITPETVKVEKWFGTAIKNDVRSRDREFTCWSGRWHYQWEGRQCTGLYECNRTPRPNTKTLTPPASTPAPSPSTESPQSDASNVQIQTVAAKTTAEVFPDPEQTGSASSSNSAPSPTGFIINNNITIDNKAINFNDTKSANGNEDGNYKTTTQSLKNKNELDLGEKIAIGLAVPCAIAAIIAIYYYVKKRINEKRAEQANLDRATNHSSNNVTPLRNSHQPTGIATIQEERSTRNSGRMSQSRMSRILGLDLAQHATGTGNNPGSIRSPTRQ